MSDITIDNYHDVKLGRKQKTFTKNDDLLKLLNYILDENRLIKAILSNFYSSRSHILCFFKMTGAGKPDCNFIFADLAENEKKYDCSTALNNFKGIKKNEIPFYKDDFIDSYRGGANGIELSTFKKTGTSNPKPNDNIKKTDTPTIKPKPNDDNIKKACNHRVIEGEFINDSLKEFRTDLEYIVNVKNKDNEYYVPDIYTNIRDKEGLKTCLQDFCFGKVNCFQMKKVEKIEAPKSIILKSVYDYLNIGSEQEFYDKLEVCLFGALNITHKDKEPPTIYVDINNVKSIIAGKDEFTFNNNPGVFETFKYNLEKTYALASRISNKHSVFPQKYIYDLLVKCKDMINKPSLTLAEIETLKKVFDLIDDENAKTAIGTLEFMNRISKFNTVNSVCFIINDNRHYEPL
jgi:hypothetical protein